MRGCLTLLGRVVILIVFGIVIFLLGRAALTGVSAIREQLAIRADQDVIRATFPGIATRIALAATDKAVPTVTPTAATTDTPAATSTPLASNTRVPATTIAPTVIPAVVLPTTVVPPAFTASYTPTTPNTPTNTPTSTATRTPTRTLSFTPEPSEAATGFTIIVSTVTRVSSAATPRSPLPPTAVPITQTFTLQNTATVTIPFTAIPSATPSRTFTPRFTATYTATKTLTKTPTKTATYTLNVPASATQTLSPQLGLPTDTPPPTLFIPTRTAAVTTLPTRRRPPPTNTPALPNTLSAVVIAAVPTGTPLPPTATALPTETPISVPTKSPTWTFTAVQAATATEITNALVAFDVVPTSTLPPVYTRDECTTRPQSTAVPPRAPRLKANGSDILNILLIGSDSDVDPGDASYRTDTLMIVSINRTANTVAMLSLPRDLYVCIPELGMQRINTAFQWGESVGWTPGGGFGLLQETILYNFGVPVHHYARISLLGFKQIIDTLGGVDIAVDCPIRNELRYMGDDSAGQPIYEPFTAEPGVYSMNGSFALWYVRSRKNSSDFDRNRRQQQMLRAIWRKARDQGLIQQAPALWTQLNTIVKTDLQLPDVLGLVPLALDLQLDQITNYYMYKGYTTEHWRTPAGEDVQIPMRGAVAEMLLNFYTPPSKNRLGGEAASVTIQNATAKTGMDAVAVEALALKGIPGTRGADQPSADRTVVIDYTGGAYPATLETLLTTLNLSADRVIVQADPNRTTDFQVTLGTDYNSCSAPGFGVS